MNKTNKTKIRIDCVNISMPRQINEPNLIRTDKQRKEIAKLRKELSAEKRMVEYRQHQRDTISEELVELRRKYEKSIRMRTTSTEINNELVKRLEKADEIFINQCIEINDLTKLLDSATDPGKKEELDTQHPVTRQTETGDIIISPDPVPGPGLPYNNLDGGPLEQLGDKLANVKADPELTVKDVNYVLDLQLDSDEKPRLTVRSQRTKNCSLTTAEVWQVRRYLKSGRRNTWIEKKMGMSSAAVSQIKSGKSYKKVPKEPRPKPTTVHAGEGVIEQKKKK